MNGLELSRAFFEQCGLPMLQNDFAELLPLLAVGFVGSGSEHYGFDDEISRDHDFEPGFSIFLPGESVVDRRTEFLLERAYAKLPKEFMGFRRSTLAPVGGKRNGVTRTAEYYLSAVGSPDGALSVDAWLHIPDYALSEATNGDIFFDNYGEFTAIRQRLRTIPEDVRRKRMAGNLLLMAQAGQYNFRRCLRHGEPEAAQLAATEFVHAALKCIFLLHGRTVPYYKWAFRALLQLPDAEDWYDNLSLLLRGDNRDSGVALAKAEAIEEIAAYLIVALQEQGLSKADCGDLEKHAYSVNDSVSDANIRNLHILTSV